MPNLFLPLHQALSSLIEHAHVLPATGQAMEDQAIPDLEEVYDQRTGGAGKVQTIFEAPNRRLYRKVEPIPRIRQHVFRYFLDGSVRTYFIGTVIEHDRSSPVQIAQVGAAAVRREDDGRLRIAAVRRKLLLMLDKSSLSDVLWHALEQAAASTPDLEVVDTSQDDGYLEAIRVEERRSRGAHKANWKMREVEVAVARELPRAAEDWLVLDGGLGNEYLDWKGPPLIGVAKSFRRDVQFHLGTGPRAQTLTLYTLLAGLEVGHRTCVFPRWPGESREGKVVFWYVRIRPQCGLDYPLMGVVKVEMPNPGQEPVDSALVDWISGALVAERSVTPYGKDSRWHAHLYPVYIAESVIKNHFYSPQVLKAAIRWPERRG